MTLPLTKQKVIVLKWVDENLLQVNALQQFCDERVLVVGGGDDPHLTPLDQEIWKMLEEDDDQDSDTLTAGCSGCYTN